MVTALDGSTPLHVAANKGNCDIMKLLLHFFSTLEKARISKKFEG